MSYPSPPNQWRGSGLKESSITRSKGIPLRGKGRERENASFFFQLRNQFQHFSFFLVLVTRRKTYRHSTKKRKRLNYSHFDNSARFTLAFWLSADLFEHPKTSLVTRKKLPPVTATCFQAARNDPPWTPTSFRDIHNDFPRVHSSVFVGAPHSLRNFKGAPATCFSRC